MKKRFLALALGTLAFGVTLGGVKMGLGHQDALMVKAAETEKTIVFNATSDPIKEKMAFTKDGVSISITEGTFLNKTDFRCYANASMTIGVVDKSQNIVAIEFTCTASGNSKGSPAGFTTKVGDYTCAGKIGKWIGKQNEVVFDASKQVRAAKISVTVQSPETNPEPSSPVTSVTAVAKEGSTFYAGASVSNSNFVFTGFDADGKETTLTGEITIENPLLVEGKNTIKFKYQSGETVITFDCEIEAAKVATYIKTINVKDIAVGKRVLIAGKDGAAVLGAETVINKKKVR